jgi:hypothetical protein
MGNLREYKCEGNRGGDDFVDHCEVKKRNCGDGSHWTVTVGLTTASKTRVLIYENDWSHGENDRIHGLNGWVMLSCRRSVGTAGHNRRA